MQGRGRRKDGGTNTHPDRVEQVVALHLQHMRQPVRVRAEARDLEVAVHIVHNTGRPCVCGWVCGWEWVGVGVGVDVGGWVSQRAWRKLVI